MTAKKVNKHSLKYRKKHGLFKYQQESNEKERKQFDLNVGAMGDLLPTIEICTKLKELNPQGVPARFWHTQPQHKDQLLKAARDWHRRNPYKTRDIKFRLSSSFSGNIRKSLYNKKSGYHWEQLVGYTLEQLKRHLEKQFTEGMTWENYGKWQIDHIIPIAAFKYSSPDDPDFKRCWALGNLRPLWAYDNRSKADNIIKPFQPSMKITFNEALERDSEGL